MQEISSLQNSIVKKIVQLQEKSRLRKKEGLFIVEGKRELLLALKGGFKTNALILCLDLVAESEINSFTSHFGKTTLVTKEVYQKIAYRGSTEGVLAILQSKETNLSNLTFSTKTPLILVAEAPEKPGNIGALLRTADAANIDAVLIANPRTDLYNPNIIRSSVGCVFTHQIATGTTQEIINFLNSKAINIYAATLQNSNAYHLENYKKSTAIVVGTEADGLSEEWRKAAKQNIIIPMGGTIDSMNVSVAAGILLFEAKRQRKFL